MKLPSNSLFITTMLSPHHVEPLPDKDVGEKILTIKEFKQLMGTAEPMTQEEFMKNAIPAGYWYRGSFATPKGIYRFNLGPGE